VRFPKPSNVAAFSEPVAFSCKLDVGCTFITECFHLNF
jgi:hypothetical protein